MSKLEPGDRVIIKKGSSAINIGGGTDTIFMFGSSGILHKINKDGVVVRVGNKNVYYRFQDQKDLEKIDYIATAPGIAQLIEIITKNSDTKKDFDYISKIHYYLSLAYEEVKKKDVDFNKVSVFLAKATVTIFTLAGKNGLDLQEFILQETNEPKRKR